MAEVVNLRQARKRSARDEKTRIAEQNRLLHGRTRADKARDAAEGLKTANFLDGHLRERASDDDETP